MDNSISLNVIKIVPPNETLQTITSHRELKRHKQSTFLEKMLSIRVVLVVITIITVISLAIGLIVLSVEAQNNIVKTLSDKIQTGVAKQITDEVGNLFQWADNELLAARLMFQVTPGLTGVPNGTNPFVTGQWAYLAEYLWSIVRKHPVGTETEFDFLDGRMYGFESFDYASDLYWVDYVNDSLYEVGWPAALSETINNVNFSSTDYLYSFPFGPKYSWIDDPTRTFMTSCTSPSVWFDLWLYLGTVANYYIISDYISICNDQGDMIGYLTVSLGLSSITDLLQSVTDEVKGKIFIMDEMQQLVASSTNSNIFTVYENRTYTRNTIFNTDEVWISQMVDLMDGNYGEQSKTVTINGTIYFLTVTHWNQFDGIDWYIAKLFNQDQFLGDSHAFYVKCVIAASCVSAAAIIVVLIVTWATTKPLFILASDLQRMSRLDLDISDMSTPRLLEVGRLYRSVASMYVALRSFKKFVPAQIISKIIKSEKEVTAELASAKITIVFQDIEGFTSLSESMDPMALAKLTSEYMEIMTDIICKHGGTIDKYVGDCIMSLFNAPEEVPDHPVAATISATECITALVRKNVEWKQKYGCEMQCRIGINTGEVLIGNMGSDHRMSYTAFGDNVNVASRLEGVNKHFGTRIIVSKSVFVAFPKGKFLTRKLAKVRVSGKARPTSIFEVRGEDSATTTHLFQLYERSLCAFKTQDFSNAMDLINQALELDVRDKPSQMLRERISVAMASSPLPPGWTYVEDLMKL